MSNVPNPPDCVKNLPGFIAYNRVILGPQVHHELSVRLASGAMKKYVTATPAAGMSFDEAPIRLSALARLDLRPIGATTGRPSGAAAPAGPTVAPAAAVASPIVPVTPVAPVASPTPAKPSTAVKESKSPKPSAPKLRRRVKRASKGR